LPFALTLLGILLAHELGHYFACAIIHPRSYPLFHSAPTLIGTFGAFILLLADSLDARALRRGASGRWSASWSLCPQWVTACLHAKVIPALAATATPTWSWRTSDSSSVTAMLQPNAHASDLLLHPRGRRGLGRYVCHGAESFAVGQLDGGNRAIGQPAAPPAGFRSRSIALVPLAIFNGSCGLGADSLWTAIRPHGADLRSSHRHPNRSSLRVVRLLCLSLCFMPTPSKGCW